MDWGGRVPAPENRPVGTPRTDERAFGAVPEGESRRGNTVRECAFCGPLSHGHEHLSVFSLPALLDPFSRVLEGHLAWQDGSSRATPWSCRVSHSTTKAKCALHHQGKFPPEASTVRAYLRRSYGQGQAASRWPSASLDLFAGFGVAPSRRWLRGKFSPPDCPKKGHH